MRPLGHNLLDRLVEFWPLSEQASVRLGVHAGLHLTDNNTVTGADGVGSLASQFTAANSEYLSRASEAALQMGDIDFTLAAWVYLDAVGADRTILGKHDAATAAGSEFMMRYNHATTRFRFALLNASVSTTVDANPFGAPSTATWYLVMGRYDAAADLMGISVNAGAEDTAAQTGGTNVLTNGFHVGALNTLAHFSGRIQRVGMWKRLLTADERSWLYNGGRGRNYPFVEP